MKKSEIITLLNKNMEKNRIDFKLNNNSMDKLAIDVSRVLDGKITSIINNIKREENLQINSLQKEKIRNYLIGYPVNLNHNFKKYNQKVTDEEYKKAYSLIGIGFERNKQTMIASLVARTKKIFLQNQKNITKKYLDYIHEEQLGKRQLLIIEVNADYGYTADNISEIIKEKYKNLSNYHHAIIIFKDGKHNTTDWSTISKVTIFMEQFKKEYKFKVYENKNKNKRIDELKDFLLKNKHVNLTADLCKEIENFYNGVAYGFQFEDLLVSSNGKIKVLVMQKVELDEKPKRCPECFQDDVRGNSYSRVLYKSFECKNPSCPARSKIGRGKRYDFYSAKRQIMLDRNSSNDYIDDETYTAFRRDVISEKEITINKLILLYSWEGDSIELINSKVTNKHFSYKKRDVIESKFTKFTNKDQYNNLPLIRLLKSINNCLIYPNNFNFKNYEKIESSYIFNGDSTDLIPLINKKTNIKNINGAITSPPYYNAREYSQWPNLICYLVDMMANAKAVFLQLNKKGTYIYNIGDVVGQDNIYIRSNMSKRRQMLGFFSIAIFEIVGFKTIGNIIWDKGEVQSKRNSTPNHFSGYVKPINAFEHCFIFSKAYDKELIPTSIKRIEPVKKINSKGENILGHTAPYPKDIAKLIIPFVKTNEYVIDPFLGSGTTIIALNEEGYLSLGFELDLKYYKLALDRIYNSSNDLLKLL